MELNRLLSLKEWKALPGNENRTKRGYRKYVKEWKKSHKEADKMGFAEKVLGVPQAIAERMKPEADVPKPPPFVLGEAEAQRREYYPRVSMALKDALKLTADVPNGAAIAQLIKEALTAAIDMESKTRKMIENIGLAEMYSREIIEIDEKRKAGLVKNREIVQVLADEVIEAEKKLVEKKEGEIDA